MSGAGAAPSFLHALENHSRQRPDRFALKFLARGEEVTGSITYAALWREVEAMAAGLAAHGLAGRPVVLAIPLGVGLIVGLLACLRAGALAVPVPFPVYKEGRRRLAAILGDLRQTAILTDMPDALAEFDLTGARILSASTLASGSACRLPAMPGPHDPALIQYSSGSTRAPRGIVLSHANIGSNAAMVREAFGTDERLVCVNWLPPHHDMGLFGAIVQPLFVGGTAVLMPPFAFVQRPMRWLRAIQEHRGTMAGGPNFGYELCIRRIPAAYAAALDLSSLEVAFCGAEPIRAATLRRFADHFAAARFSPSMFLPCYGLAEATLLVSAERPRRGPREVLLPSVAGGPARARISCGIAPTGCRISIRDPETGRPATEGAVGEVCVAGDHVAAGQWQGQSATIVPLGDVLEDRGTRWLRTGDVGMLSDSGLLVLDRLKDVIFCYGRNVHATDVEAAALDGSGENVMAAAAFAVEAPQGEELVLICEISAARSGQLDAEARRRRIADAVAEQCGVAPRVVFVAPAALPRTTSGKIRRQVARQDYREGRLRPLAAVEGEWVSS